MDFDKVLKKRASIKNYSEKKVKIEKIIDLISASNLAPSPGNLPIIKYIIVEDPEKIEKISNACQQPFINKAKVVVIFCSDPKNAERMYDIRAETYVKHHIGAAVENFLLKATDLKLVSCWVGAFSEITIKNLLKIPEDINVEVILPVGNPIKSEKTTQKKKPILDSRVFFENWNNKEKVPREKIKDH